eukprot:10684572-Alexandrium_andersonii.AAC.1
MGRFGHLQFPSLVRGCGRGWRIGFRAAPAAHLRIRVSSAVAQRSHAWAQLKLVSAVWFDLIVSETGEQIRELQILC